MAPWRASCSCGSIPLNVFSDGPNPNVSPAMLDGDDGQPRQDYQRTMSHVKVSDYAEYPTSLEWLSDDKRSSSDVRRKDARRNNSSASSEAM